MFPQCMFIMQMVAINGEHIPIHNKISFIFICVHICPFIAAVSYYNPDWIVRRYCCLFFACYEYKMPNKLICSNIVFLWTNWQKWRLLFFVCVCVSFDRERRKKNILHISEIQMDRRVLNDVELKRINKIQGKLNQHFTHSEKWWWSFFFVIKRQ